MKKDRVLYVDDNEYCASVVDFDIDEKVYRAGQIFSRRGSVVHAIDFFV